MKANVCEAYKKNLESSEIEIAKKAKKIIISDICISITRLGLIAK